MLVLNVCRLYFFFLFVTQKLQFPCKYIKLIEVRTVTQLFDMLLLNEFLRLPFAFLCQTPTVYSSIYLVSNDFGNGVSWIYISAAKGCWLGLVLVQSF